MPKIQTLMTLQPLVMPGDFSLALQEVDASGDKVKGKMRARGGGLVQ